MSKGDRQTVRQRQANGYRSQIEINAESGWISIYVSLTTPSRLYLHRDFRDYLSTLRARTHAATGPAGVCKPHQLGSQPPTLVHGRAHAQFMRRIPRGPAARCPTAGVSGFHRAEIRTRIAGIATLCPLRFHQILYFDPCQSKDNARNRYRRTMPQCCGKIL